jgi:hypothetical protein
MPFWLPNFVCDPKQVVEMRCGGKQTGNRMGAIARTMVGDRCRVTPKGSRARG